MTDHPFSFPNASRNSVTLANGKTLSYYTFDTDPAESLHPVLYIHGFPGCGLEGSMCANQVDKAGGQLFAIDRPGFGHSDPYNHDVQDENARLDAFCEAIWNMIHQLKWKSFSVIGVSGAGPYTLALLDSYLNKTRKSETQPKLEAVCFVAGICCAAGTKGMMPINENLFHLVESNDTSRWSRIQLKLMFGVPSVLFKVLPGFLLTKLMPTKDLPKVDQDLIADAEISQLMLDIASLAFRQGSEAAVLEAKTLFRPEPKYDFGEYGKKLIPKISVFQGLLDVNVPASHSEFVHKSFPEGSCDIHKYDDLGHASMIATKADDYARVAVPKSIHADKIKKHSVEIKERNKS